jgi:benzylsuccinate CoA-transferase BbsF subunit
MQGRSGPHSLHRGLGHQLTALSGLCQITGWPDREPPWIGAYTDFVAPLFNALAVLAALDYRRRTGKGQYFDVSQYENGVHFLAPLVLDYVANGRTAGREGNHHAEAAPHGAYRCLGVDRWCAIAVFSDEEWASFARTIGNPAWTADGRFATLTARKDNEEELDRLVEEWTCARTAEEVMRLMQAAAVAAGVLQTGQDILDNDPQLRHRHSFWELEHPEVGVQRAQGPPFLLSKAPCRMSRAPMLGEHGGYVLKELLGMSDEEVAGLVIGGVVQ